MLLLSTLQISLINRDILPATCIKFYERIRITTDTPGEDMDTALKRYLRLRFTFFMEQEKGIIEQRALADFILLDKHPDDISAKRSTSADTTNLASRQKDIRY